MLILIPPLLIAGYPPYMGRIWGYMIANGGVGLVLLARMFLRGRLRVRREHLGEAAEGQAVGADRGRGGLDGVSIGGQPADGLAEQAALSDTGIAAENQAPGECILRGRSEPVQIGNTPDEVPVTHAASISRSVTIVSLAVPLRNE